MIFGFRVVLGLCAIEILKELSRYSRRISTPYRAFQSTSAESKSIRASEILPDLALQSFSERIGALSDHRPAQHEKEAERKDVWELPE